MTTKAQQGLALLEGLEKLDKTDVDLALANEAKAIEALEAQIEKHKANASRLGRLRVLITGGYNTIGMPGVLLAALRSFDRPVSKRQLVQHPKVKAEVKKNPVGADARISGALTRLHRRGMIRRQGAHRTAKWSVSTKK